jgi:hypothetical protein
MTAAPSSLPLPLVEPYFAAWTARDPKAMAATFAEDGTDTGPWNAQPPAGRPAAMRGADVVTVTAGKITSVGRYCDRQAMAGQLRFQMRPPPPALMRPACSKANTERTPCPVAAETDPDLAVGPPGLHQMRSRENRP